MQAQLARSVERQYDRAFYTGMSLAVIVAIFRGFAPSYYLRSQRLPPLPPLVQIHGLLFSAWALLFVTQTVLIARRRTDLHRRIGMGGAVLAAAMVVVGLTTAIVGVRRNMALGHQGALTFLAIPFGDMLTFLVLVSAAVWFRRRAEIHKRLMLLATIAILDAAVARWPLAIMATGPMAFFGVTDFFIVAGVIYDLVSRRRVHPAYIWGGLFIVASQSLRLAVWHTSAWLAFARMLVG